MLTGRTDNSCTAAKPVNIVVRTKAEKPTVAQLSAAGVKRISTGSALYAHATAALQAAAAALNQGDLATATTGMPRREMFALISRGLAFVGAGQCAAGQDVAAHRGQ